MKNLTFLLILTLLFSVSCTAQSNKIEAKPAEQEITAVKEEPIRVTMQEVIIETTMGNITIALYNETPLHRDNFIKLVNEKFYEESLFHRIIQQFMIQAGDPNSINAAKGIALGTGGPGYTIPAEIIPGKLNKRGAVAAARTGDNVNPERRSSGSQFYIVDKHGGATHLDGQYTVFGEVVKGMDVVDIIAAQPKDRGDRPVEDIKIISMKLVEQ
ncbi:MAG: peptidylprolyl isomerase [Bacteroidales bacterium]|jgi:cyclophilin family peptidyl-prolyl cis-trans isomerase|nr:peptidylprolyl isomerase [Bacteroidales bacterium]